MTVPTLAWNAGATRAADREDPDVGRVVRARRASAAGIDPATTVTRTGRRERGGRRCERCGSSGSPRTGSVVLEDSGPSRALHRGGRRAVARCRPGRPDPARTDRDRVGEPVASTRDPGPHPRRSVRGAGGRGGRGASAEDRALRLPGAAGALPHRRGRPAGAPDARRRPGLPDARRRRRAHLRAARPGVRRGRVGLVEGRGRQVGGRAVLAGRPLGQPRALDVPPGRARRHRHRARRARQRPGRGSAGAPAAHRRPGDRHRPAGGAGCRPGRPRSCAPPHRTPTADERLDAMRSAAGMRVDAGARTAERAAGRAARRAPPSSGSPSRVGTRPPDARPPAPSYRSTEPPQRRVRTAEPGAPPSPDSAAVRDPSRAIRARSRAKRDAGRRRRSSRRHATTAPRTDTLRTRGRAPAEPPRPEAADARPAPRRAPAHPEGQAGDAVLGRGPARACAASADLRRGSAQQAEQQHDPGDHQPGGRARAPASARTAPRAAGRATAPGPSPTSRFAGTHSSPNASANARLSTTSPIVTSTAVNAATAARWPTGWTPIGARWPAGAGRAARPDRTPSTPGRRVDELDRAAQHVRRPARRAAGPALPHDLVFLRPARAGDGVGQRPPLAQRLPQRRRQRRILRLPASRARLAPRGSLRPLHPPVAPFSLSATVRPGRGTPRPPPWPRSASRRPVAIGIRTRTSAAASASARQARPLGAEQQRHPLARRSPSPAQRHRVGGRGERGHPQAGAPAARSSAAGHGSGSSANGTRSTCPIDTRTLRR